MRNINSFKGPSINDVGSFFRFYDLTGLPILGARGGECPPGSAISKRVANRKNPPKYITRQSRLIGILVEFRGQIFLSAKSDDCGILTESISYKDE